MNVIGEWHAPMTFTDEVLRFPRAQVSITLKAKALRHRAERPPPQQTEHYAAGRSAMFLRAAKPSRYARPPPLRADFYPCFFLPLRAASKSSDIVCKEGGRASVLGNLARRFGGRCPQIRNRHLGWLASFGESFEFGSPDCMIP